jgi:hypothetical protein
MRTNLGDKMIELADSDSLPVDHKMRTLAMEFNKAVEKGCARSVLGAWARARRCYCEYTGESLI